MATNHHPARFGTSGSSMQLTDEQQAMMAPVEEMIATTFPRDEESANIARNAALRYVSTAPEHRDLTLDEVAEDVREAKGALGFAYASARATAVVAIADGRSEVAVATGLGVDRMTIRKWLGKVKH